jgi:hypothetical protein
MFLVDKLLASPFAGLMWIFEELNKTAVEEVVGKSKQLSSELSELYMLLEQGQIDIAAFTEQERVLLDQLDALWEEEEEGENEDDEDDNEEEKDEDEANDEQIQVRPDASESIDK